MSYTFSLQVHICKPPLFPASSSRSMSQYLCSMPSADSRPAALNNGKCTLLQGRSHGETLPCSWSTDSTRTAQIPRDSFSGRATKVQPSRIYSQLVNDCQRHAPCRQNCLRDFHFLWSWFKRRSYQPIVIYSIKEHGSQPGSRPTSKSHRRDWRFDIPD